MTGMKGPRRRTEDQDELADDNATTTQLWRRRALARVQREDLGFGARAPLSVLALVQW